MKACGYCGRENEDDLAHCRECGTEFPLQKQTLPGPRLIDLDQVEGAFDFHEGFSRPDWKVIWRKIKTDINPEDRREAWNDIAVQWLTRLQAELGGDYYLIKSGHFILLADIEKDAARRLLNSAEKAMTAIRNPLKEVAWQEADGLQVLIFFSEEDDYYQYISGFYQDGTHPKNGGVHIKTGYSHIAVPFHGEVTAANTIVHELTHSALNGLKIPTWLNEGLAVVLEKVIGGRTGGVAWQELIDRHHQFWNQERIQQFWAGTSFHEVGDAVELSYSLAEIFVSQLVKDRDAFIAFLRSASPDDAGQTAALDCLEVCLGDTAAAFLGAGDWRPQRKAIKTCWNAERPVTKKPDETGAV